MMFLAGLFLGAVIIGPVVGFVLCRTDPLGIL